MEKRQSVKRIISFILISVMVLTLSACGNSNTQLQDKQITDEDYIVRVTGSFPLYSDPGVGSSAIEAAAQMNLYDALVFADLDGSVKSHIADSWTMSDDGMKYTFKIKEGIKFHSGNELTADDVAFSMNRMLTIGEGFAYLYTPYVKEAVATDEYTVEINMKKTFGPFINSLVRMYVVDKKLILENLKDGSYGEFKDYGKEYLLTHDAGSGPYKIKDVKLEEYLLGQKFDDYWQEFDENSPKYFKIISTGDPVTVRTLMSRRELEIVDEWQSVDNITALAKVKGIKVPLMQAGAMVDMDINTKIPPTDDIHVRKALSYLIDYEKAKTIIYPDTMQAVGPVSSVYKGHNNDLFQYSFSLEKAEEELKQSKYYGKLDQYPITCAWSAAVPDEEKLSLVLQSNAAQVGIKVNIEKTQFGMLIQEAQSIETTPNITIMYPGDSYNEAGSVLALRYHSSTAGTFTQFEWLLNPEIDKSIEDALSTMDESERMAKYKKIQEDLVDLCPTIWVVENPERRAYQSYYLEWPEADAAFSGELNVPVMGRFLYFRTMKVYPEKRIELLKQNN